MSLVQTPEFEIIIRILVFAAGLCVGSFLNVCIFRIPDEKSVVSPPSACPHCGAKLKVPDMIPVLGFLLLKGRCRYCKSPISPQYPLVELLTGVIWILVYLRYGLSVETLALIYLFSVLIPIVFIDLKYMIIPNGLVLAGLAGGAVLALYHIFFKPFSLYDSSLWYTPLIGMVSASGILFIIALLGFAIYKNDGAMGMGDVKLFLPIGLFLGWKLSLLSLFIAVIAGGIVSVILLILRIKDRKSPIPFGPFIVIATIISGFYGVHIINWYLGI